MLMKHLNIIILWKEESKEFLRRVNCHSLHELNSIENKISTLKYINRYLIISSTHLTVTHTIGQT